jgi:hypothetical protein
MAVVVMQDWGAARISIELIRAARRRTKLDLLQVGNKG